MAKFSCQKVETGEAQETHAAREVGLAQAAAARGLSARRRVKCSRIPLLRSSPPFESASRRNAKGDPAPCQNSQLTSLGLCDYINSSQSLNIS